MRIPLHAVCLMHSYAIVVAALSIAGSTATCVTIPHEESRSLCQPDHSGRPRELLSPHRPPAGSLDSNALSSIPPTSVASYSTAPPALELLKCEPIPGVVEAKVPDYEPIPVVGAEASTLLAREGAGSSSGRCATFKVKRRSDERPSTLRRVLCLSKEDASAVVDNALRLRDSLQNPILLACEDAFAIGAEAFMAARYCAYGNLDQCVKEVT